jgi:uncharacterized protein (DUF2267 family)
MGSMEPSSYSDIVRRLRDLGSFADEASAGRALSGSLLALGAALSKVEQEALAGALPAELAQTLRLARPWAGASRADFFRTAVAQHCVPTALAIEHTALVCRVLGEVLTPTARKRLARALPAVARLLVPAAPESLGTTQDPHGETKLSKSCGLTQERESRTLSQLHRTPHRSSSGRH